MYQWFRDIAVDEYGGVYLQSSLFPSGIFRFDPRNVESTFEKVVGGTQMGGGIEVGGTFYVPEGMALGTRPGEASTLYWSNLFVLDPEPIDDSPQFEGTRIVSSKITPLIPGDMDRDGEVGFQDFLILSTRSERKPMSTVQATSMVTASSHSAIFWFYRSTTEQDCPRRTTAVDARRSHLCRLYPGIRPRKQQSIFRHCNVMSFSADERYPWSARQCERSWRPSIVG